MCLTIESLCTKTKLYTPVKNVGGVLLKFCGTFWDKILRKRELKYWGQTFVAVYPLVTTSVQCTRNVLGCVIPPSRHLSARSSVDQLEGGLKPFKLLSNRNRTETKRNETTFVVFVCSTGILSLLSWYLSTNFFPFVGFQIFSVVASGTFNLCIHFLPYYCKQYMSILNDMMEINMFFCQTTKSSIFKKGIKNIMTL